jgi:hypothetical protein
VIAARARDASLRKRAWPLAGRTDPRLRPGERSSLRVALSVTAVAVMHSSAARNVSFVTILCRHRIDDSTEY